MTILSAGGGSDRLDGGTGTDFLWLDLTAQGTGVVFKGNASNHLSLSDGTGAKNGEQFIVYGTNFDDTLIGGSLGDTLIGYGGDDTLVGGAGDDGLYGGGGRDRLDGGTGTDSLSLDLSAETAGVVFKGNASNHLSLPDGTSAKNGEQFEVVGTNLDDTLIGGSFGDYLWGNGGNDELVGGDGGLGTYNYLFGGIGDDKLTGGTGDDTFFGGDGNDRVDGRAGNDWLEGEIGNDKLTGGEGNDYFAFMGVDSFSDLGIDVVADFTETEDLMVLSIPNQSYGGVQFETVASDADAGGSAAFVVYSTESGSLFYNQNVGALGFGDGGQFATLTNTPQLTATDFVFF